MNVQYFVNSKTRMCRILSGRGEDHQKNVDAALKDGFSECSVDEMDMFRAETQKARDAGWNPSGRTGYAKFMAKVVA
jgi:hypothetical protein